MTIGNDDAIRAFLADEARRAVAAAPSLDQAVGRLAPRIEGRPSGASQRLIVLLAATLLLAAALGTAIAVGSGILRLPLVIDAEIEPMPDLGIFEPVAGRIVYYTNSSLWAVDPSAPSVSTLVRLGPEGLADADRRFASFTVPLGWSSDGTDLLFLREDPNQQNFPAPRYVYILHADGTETQVTPEPVSGAAISPDGSRVVFAADRDDGLYVVDAEGGQPVRIAEGEEPTFSADGRQIAYLSKPRSGCCVQAGREHVWVANADGTDAHEILVEDPALAEGVFDLAWSPADDRIAMANSGEGHVAIYTFAPDGSDFTKVISGGAGPDWSPDGSQIAYGVLGGSSGLSIADADGSNVRTFDFGAAGPWHPGTLKKDATPTATIQTSSRFAGEWASTDYNDHFGAEDTSIQTMTIGAGEDGVLRVSVHDDSSRLCSDTPTTMTGTGRLEDPSTLVVPSPILACVDGSAPSGDGPSLETATSSYTLVFDLATDRLFDNREVVWKPGAPPENWADPSTRAGADGPGTFAILHGEVTFRAAAPWNDHTEAYIDPRVFFLLGPGDGGAPDGDTAEFTILVNPTPPEAPCESLRVPPSAEELVQAVRSNPDLETTVPVTERVGGIDALRMDVVAAPGASIGPCGAAGVDVVYVHGRPWGGVELGGRGRLYVLDLPGGSARTLAIWITAHEAALFEQALDTAAPVLDSFQFHAP